MSAPVLAVRDLAVRRGVRTVLEVPTLAVEDGEVLAVVGPNGAGKSTLLQALALLLPAAMTYRFLGRQADLPHGALALRRQMAVVFQDPLLLQGSVRDNVALGLRLRGLPRGEVEGRVSRWLRHFGVEHLAARHARTLSGGEAQRVSLARAFAMQPRVLFLDEPFRPLDVLGRAAVIPTLRQALRESGVTALFVTHDFTEILPLADRVAVVLDGKVVQTAPPLELFRNPLDDRVAALVRAATDLSSGLASEQSPSGGLSQ